MGKFSGSPTRKSTKGFGNFCHDARSLAENRTSGSSPDDIISGGGRFELSFSNLSILIQDELLRINKTLSHRTGVADNINLLPTTECISSSTQMSQEISQENLTIEDWANGIVRILCSTLKCAQQTLRVALGGTHRGTLLLCYRPSDSTTALVEQFVSKQKDISSEDVTKFTTSRDSNDRHELSQACRRIHGLWTRSSRSKK